MWRHDSHPVLEWLLVLVLIGAGPEAEPVPLGVALAPRLAAAAEIVVKVEFEFEQQGLCPPLALLAVFSWSSQVKTSFAQQKHYSLASVWPFFRVWGPELWLGHHAHATGASSGVLMVVLWHWVMKMRASSSSFSHWI